MLVEHALNALKLRSIRRVLAANGRCDSAPASPHFLFLRNERHYAPSSIALTLAALRTFYRDHLGVGRDWKLWQELKVRRIEPLPTVLY